MKCSPLVLAAAILLSAPVASAMPITIDFDYSGGGAPGFFQVPSIYREVGVADAGAMADSFYDSGVTFVNTEFAGSPLSADGFTITDASAAQYGTMTLFWDTYIQSATLDFVAPEPGASIALGINGGDFSYWNMGFFDELSIQIFSETPFNYLTIPAYHSAFLDTVTYEAEPIPEPASLLLFGAGCALVGVLRRRRIHLLNFSA